MKKHLRNALVLAAVASALAVAPLSAHASEYCVRKYEASISAANNNLLQLLNRQTQIDEALQRLLTEKDDLTDEIAELSKDGLTEAEVRRVEEIGRRLTAISRERAPLQSEGFANTDKIASLRTTVPANLQGELKI